MQNIEKILYEIFFNKTLKRKRDGDGEEEQKILKKSKFSNNKNNKFHSQYFYQF